MAPQCGRNRAAFISRKYVVKFPLNDNGELDNTLESSTRTDNTAKGRAIMLGGFFCVVQEKLSPAHGVLPSWVQAVDSQQVGYDSGGRLKIFDFGKK